MRPPVRHAGAGRLAAGVFWALLLLGLWLWGREAAEVPPGVFGPATGDMAAVGRPAGPELPTAAEPLADALPQRLEIPGLGVRASVVGRGQDGQDGQAGRVGRDGQAGQNGQDAAGPPSASRSAAVDWYAAGTKPGSAGTAVMVGRADTGTRPAVLRRIGALRPGETVRVARDDGTVAEFTVDDVRELPRDRCDAGRAAGPHEAGRAELRLITCGGAAERAGEGAANVMVSAYLTGTGR
ncbi:sortase [Streptomyces sp. NPDC001508]|uniref:sortase domain-containing protein n=1 Tax=Streptomyces sp. NPDC001508 TaxID=3154656 RepID=UPI00331E2848